MVSKLLFLVVWPISGMSLKNDQAIELRSYTIPIPTAM